VLAGRRLGALSPQTEMRALSFESSTTLAQKHAYVAVQAVDANGRMLGTSRTVAVITYAASLRSASRAP